MRAFCWRSVGFTAAAVLLLPGGAAAQQREVEGEGLVRLVANDDLRCTFGFTTGGFGRAIQDGKVHNRNSQVAYRVRDGVDVWSFGVQGSEQGVAIDLGPLRDRSGGTSLFWRIGMKEAEQRLAGETWPTPVAVQLDHVYVARIEDVAVAGAGVAKGGTMFLRLHVVDCAPGRYVEFRYAILREQAGAPPAAADAAAGEAPAWMRSRIQRREDVFDPKTLPQLEWPDSVAAADRKQVEELLADLRGGGMPGVRARTRLEKLAYPAFVGCIRALRDVDYLSEDDSFFAWDLNRILDDMLYGLNAGFARVRIDEDLDLSQADWNAKTVQAWHGLASRLRTADEFGQLVATRKQQQQQK